MDTDAIEVDGFVSDTFLGGVDVHAESASKNDASMNNWL